MSIKFKVILEEDEEVGGYVVTCPAFPGCYSQGETKDEALENIKEAIQLYFESISKDEIDEAQSRPNSHVVEVVI